MALQQGQNARAVAYRALCLGTMLKRGEIELAIQDVSQWAVFDDVREHMLKKHRQDYDQLCQWIHDEDIMPYFSEYEHDLLAQPLGHWTERSLIYVGWRIEALGMMLWALNHIETVPAFDQQFGAEQVLEPLDLLQPTIDFIWMADLRDESQLLTVRDQAELWNWRSRATELEAMGFRPPEGVTFSEVIRLAAERAYLAGQIPSPIAGDFPAFNKAYADLAAEEYTLMSAIALERVHALNWICEISHEWEAVRVDNRNQH